jgi:hypothetical protein
LRVTCVLCLSMLLLARSVSAADQTAAIQRLLDEAVRNGQARVELPPGVVRIEGRLRLRGARGLEIAGPRTTLLAADAKTTALSIYDCQNLVLRGFTLDYDPLPFVQGRITDRAADGTWFDFEVHAGYPGLDVTRPDTYRSLAAYVFEARQARWKRWVPDLYPRRVEVRDARHGRLTFGRAPEFHEQIAVGDRLIIALRTGCGLRMDNCANVRVEDVTFLAAPGAALLARYMRGENFYRYTVQPGPTPKGTTEPRLISTCADAFNYAFATRGPTLDGCRFSFMGDDSVNLHGAVLVVLRRLGPRELLVGWPYTAESLATVMPAGALVRRLRPGNFQVLGSASLTGFVEEKQRRPEDMQLIQRIWPRNPPDRGAAWRLTLGAPLEAQPGELLDIPANNAPGFVIRNCTFADHRARGLRIMAGQGTIEGNTFQRIRTAAIAVGTEYGFWREAGWVERITIRNNRIEDVCQEYGAFAPRCYALGAISIFARRDERNQDPYWPGNRQIMIEGNRIYGSTTAGIYAAAAAQVTIRGNELRNVLYHPGTKAGVEAGLDLRDPIDVRHAVQVQVRDNRLIDVGAPPAGVENLVR